MEQTLPPEPSAKINSRQYLLYGVVITVALLLLVNVYLIYENSRVISYNVGMQKETEQVKLNTLDIIRNLHQVDMGLRGYALIYSEVEHEIVTKSYRDKDVVFASLERSLKKQNYPMADLQYVNDSINLYYDVVAKMERLVDETKIDSFKIMLEKDLGFAAWLTYRGFSERVHAFEDDIARKAESHYQNALRNSYFLQMILFLITVPALSYTAYYTIKGLRYSDRLIKSEAEKNKILADQKKTLEHRVQERTNEILAQNEEIAAQNEEILSHYDQLQLQQDEIEKSHRIVKNQNEELIKSKQIIEDQNSIIQRKNKLLVEEVQNQTRDLKKTNHELIEHINRLKQFTYIISHNLRAPLARVIGLSTLLDSSKSEDEKNELIQLIHKSTTELDNVIRDLSQILAIQKLGTQVYSTINLSEMISKTRDILEFEINHTNTEITTSLQVTTLYSLPQYIESILHNLISNAIKYRHPERDPRITISSHKTGEYTCVEVADNGLGIDLEQHKQNLFNLYKRFHFHVEGKGLGLYLVRTQIESLDGRIEVSSLINTGTVFRIYFKSIPEN